MKPDLNTIKIIHLTGTSQPIIGFLMEGEGDYVYITEPMEIVEEADVADKNRFMYFLKQWAPLASFPSVEVNRFNINATYIPNDNIKAFYIESMRSMEDMDMDMDMEDDESMEEDNNIIKFDKSKLN